ncbi:arsenate-mycothiol transferase ArsC [Flavobacterium luminosum]|uniref:Protein-tyrosine-phosphatase n=1 Tax=Flavobacterium luminosum TaxID=2949086 RepID=A0ABT0TRC7_9FLAO|nr:protein-tyrosine-phosphatase [Flavobacterium sp. HXWNR70]MCL9810053.1 protein-tyrosine-phosphatase [Flavobacterium sp. HXWNR70]
MNPRLLKTIDALPRTISSERQAILEPLIKYIQAKKDNQQSIKLNFICTHNSRRSHLAQIWAQTMAFYFKIPKTECYSGGTETTALFPKIITTLEDQGFTVTLLKEGSNPTYAIQYDDKEPAIVGFSKVFDDAFNPATEFAAIMTCSSADEGCPFVGGAELRLPIRYEDPKKFDSTKLMTEKYTERSLEIAAEMYFVFSKIQ